MSDTNHEDKRAVERHLVETEVVFHTENDIYLASSVDITEIGIRMITEKPINISIQIAENDKLVQYDAQLVWARVKVDGTMEYGLKYQRQLTK